MGQAGAILTAREQSPCFLAELDGVPGAAGGLCLHDGVALFAGAATVPEMRRRGLQGRRDCWSGGGCAMRTSMDAIWR